MEILNKKINNNIINDGEIEYQQAMKLFLKCRFIESLSFFILSTEKQCVAACVRLAYLYKYDGLVGTQDTKKFQMYMSKAIEKVDQLIERANRMNDGDSCDVVGQCFYHTKDYSQAFEWYQKSADQYHYPFAQHHAAWCYHKGEGVKKDLVIAAQYYQLAADQGLALAQYNLGWCTQYGSGITKDLTKAIHYYQLAADQGYASAQYNLGWCYYNGEGVINDFTKAFHYYKLAADQYHASAQSNLGVCYENGEGVEQDNRRATQYYQLAAASQSLDSTNYNVAVCYEFGRGIIRNKKMAIRYYQIAANQNHTLAINQLKRLLNN